MDTQSRCENVLFLAPPLPENLLDHTTALQASAVGAPTKRPVSVFTKPSRSARLGAAAAAALAACVDDDGDTPSEAALTDCLLSPKFTSDAPSANRVINNLLETVPALPGSPTLESSDTPPAVGLSKQISALTIFQTHQGSPLGTTSGGDHSSNPGASSPRLTKCQSERGGSSGIGGGMTVTNGAATHAAIAARVTRALARKSVDAAADAVMLSTRQVSELSLAAGTAAAAAAVEEEREEEEGEEGIPAGSLSAAINAAAAAAADRSRAGAHPVAAAATAASMTASSSAPGQWSSHNSIAPSRSAGAPPSPVSPFQYPMKLKQPGRKTLREWLQARSSAPGLAEGEEGLGALRQREPEGRTRPRWLERLLRAFHAEKMYRAGKVASGGGSGSGGHDDGRYGFRDDGQADDSYEDGPYGDLLGMDSSGERFARGEELASGITSDRLSRGAGGGAGTVKVDGDGAGRSYSAVVRSPAHDQLMAATHLLSSRRGLRSPSGSDQRPLSITISRDRTTVHRACLAQQVRPLCAAVDPFTAPITHQQGGTRPRDPLGNGRAPSEGTNNAIGTVGVKGTPGSASVIGISVMAFAQAAATSESAARRPSATATTPTTAAAFNFVGSNNLRLQHVQLCTPTGAAMGMHARVRSSALHSRPRLRQLSAPGGSEPKFTSLSQLETRSVDGANSADCDNSAAVDDFAEIDEGESPIHLVALRAAGMIFPR